MRRAFFLLFLVTTACPNGEVDVDAGNPPQDSGLFDAGPTSDSGPLNDSGARDAEAADVGDTGVPTDGGAPFDAGFVTLSVATTSTGGAVISMPGTIACTEPTSGSCAETFEAGTSVTLTASAAADFAFLRWTGDCEGELANAVLFMDRDRSCTAFFIGTAGEVSLVPPPVSVVPNETEHPTDILVFREQSQMLLPANVLFDLHVPDTYNAYAGKPGTFPANLAVNVYFVHFDPIGIATQTNRRATLFFPEPIVGLIARADSLDATDAILGLAPAVTYPATGTEAERGLEVAGQDTLTLRGDRQRVDLDFLTSNSSDQFRIVTLATAGGDVPFLANGDVFVGAPASVVVGASQSSTVARVFVEQTAEVLSSDLPVDLSGPGRYSALGSESPGSIAAGTSVQSWFIHFDPVAGTQFVDASVTFDKEVLGLIFLLPNLEASDAQLGAPLVAYPTAGAEPDRQVEAGQDFVVFADDRRSVRVHMVATTGSDHVRVIVRE